MGKNSSIEWTHHTFNPWWGCVKISPACDNCYAEKWSKRAGQEVWGASAGRRFFSDNHWNDPIRWNRDAEKSRIRQRVFCASMADVFENRSDLDACRKKLWNVIFQTPMLDWLLLTKRIENVAQMVPWEKKWPDNVWLGITVENQAFADKRVPVLLQQSAKIKFVSCEPILGEIDFSRWLGKKRGSINWVIAGGESGGNARPTNPCWLRALRDQCIRFSVPFLFKQWGVWGPAPSTRSQKQISLEFECSDKERVTMVKRNKKDSGRQLDGKIWDGLPIV